MVTVSEVFNSLCALAPVERKMDFDNVGLLVGRMEKPVTRILTALDITDEVIEEAADLGAHLIVSHHPIFFELKRVTQDNQQGRKVIRLAQADISAICMHTNLDVSYGGVNDALAEALKLSDTLPMIVDGTDQNGHKFGLGRYGIFSGSAFPDFLGFVKNALAANGLRYYDAGRYVKKVAVCGGSGGSELNEAVLLGCDTYVTADIKYNVFLEAAERGINLIDAGHYPTENIIVPKLREYLSTAFPKIIVMVSKKHCQPEKFFNN